jgi:hypothetical protein
MVSDLRVQAGSEVLGRLSMTSLPDGKTIPTRVPGPLNVVAGVNWTVVTNSQRFAGGGFAGYILQIRVIDHQYAQGGDGKRVYAAVGGDKAKNLG